MHEIAVNTAATVIPRQSLTPGLFNSFVSYIDRTTATTRTYINNLRQFIAWMYYKGVTDPEREDIILYRDYLQEEHDAIRLAPESADGWAYRTDKNGNRYKVTCKPNTVAQYLRSVSQFFKWTAACNFYPDIAANIHGPKIRHDVHRKDALTAADVLTIEQSIQEHAEARATAAAAATKDTAGRIGRATVQSKRLFAMYTLAVNAGLRTVEISRARIRDLEVKDGKAVLYVWGKGHAEPDAKKPLAPEVYAAIREYLDARTDSPTANSPLFASTGNRSGGQRIAATTISKMLKQAMQQAGYDSDRITAHTLRHTAGTNVQEITGNLYTTQKYMRHANPATTEIYLHNDTEKQETETAQRLYNFYHSVADPDDDRAKLESILQGMNTEQLAQITAIAAMMTR